MRPDLHASCKVESKAYMELWGRVPVEIGMGHSNNVIYIEVRVLLGTFLIDSH